jgi:imidazolonepropionase
MMDRVFIGNCSEVVAVSSDRGLPLRGKKQNELTIIPDGCVIIEDGKIQDFGKEEELRAKYKTYPYFDSQKNIVMPAFVDPHTHLVFAGTREEEFLCRLQGESYLDTLEKGYGILSTVKATKEVTEEELFQLAIERIKLFQKQGTIGLEIKSGYGLDLETEQKMLRVINRLKKELNVPICRTFLAAHALPLEFKENRKKYIDLICNEMIPGVVSSKQADCIDVFCEKGVFTAEECYEILSKGKSMGLLIKIHTDEFASIGGLRVASDLGAISADHLIRSKEDELKLFSKKNGTAVILPGTSFALKSEDSSYGRRIVDLNIPLALGTDYNPGTCMCCSMQTMMELSVLKFGLTVKEAINASTINAAFACGFDKITGSVEIGKRADLAIFKVDTYKKMPYLWGMNKLHSLFINGKSINFA